MWPLALLAALLAFRVTGTAKAAEPTRRRRKPKKRRRRRRKPKKKKKRRAKKVPADALPDPIKDLFGPDSKTPKKKKKKRRRRRRKPPAPTPTPTKRRRRRRRRKPPAPTPTPTPTPTRSRVKPVAKPVAKKRQPSVAEQFVDDLRAGVLDRDGVAIAQRAMGELDPDGIGGGKTKGRTDTLLLRNVDWSDITWPKTPAVPTPVSPKHAARELWDYIHVYKGTRRPRIRKYQRVMGMKSTPGRIGPATKRKVLDLIGVEL